MYKKIFMGIAAVAALTLVSCSSDDLNSLSDNSSKNEAISFDGYWGRSAVSVNGSRGSVIDKAEDLQKVSEGFGVFGHYSSTDGEAFGSNLFENQKVTYSTEETKWTYSPKKYWSPQGHIDFLAYAPHVDGTTLKNTSCIEFTVAENAADQKDLLWAKAANQTKANNSGTGKKVKFQFAHALSRLGYTVKTALTSSSDVTIPSDVTITLKKITLAGSKDGIQKAFYPKGTINLSTGVWTPSTTDEKQNFVWLSTDKTLDSDTKNSDKEYLFVIPQNFSKAEENADALFVIVEYTIKYGDEKPVTYTVSSQLKQNFEQGTAYSINLTLGLTPIEFDADVTAWKDTEQKDVYWN